VLFWKINAMTRGFDLGRFGHMVLSVAGHLLRRLLFFFGSNLESGTINGSRPSES